MILAQNLLQQLSGSKILIYFFIICGLFHTIGCTHKTKSRTTKKVRVNPSKKKKTNDKKIEIVDIERKDPEINNVPTDIDIIEELPSYEKKESYNIKYLLPLQSDNLEISNKNKKFVNYLSGLLMAKQKLEKEGISLNLEIIDINGKQIGKLLDHRIDEDTDAVIGLYNTASIKQAALFAKINQIPLISPWKAIPNIAKNNSYYIQLRPNLDEYFTAIISDIHDSYPYQDVYILHKGTQRDMRMVKYIQTIAESFYNIRQPFMELHVKSRDELKDEDEMIFDSLFIKRDTNIIMIPHYSYTKDESFVYECIRNLAVEKGNGFTKVYGMELLIDSDRINFDHYNTLNINVARTKFVDEVDADVQRFRRDFLYLYGSIPTPDAYEGYDNMMFIGRNIFKYGKKFQYHLFEDQNLYLQASYNVQKTFITGSEEDTESNIDYFENKNVDILEFDGSQFHRKSIN